MSAEHSLRWPRAEWCDAPFLDDGRVRLTHGEAAASVALSAERIAPHHARCVVETEPTIACVLAILALWSRGALALLVDRRAPPAVRAALAKASGATETFEGAMTPAPRGVDALDLPLDALAAALPTSGSSGAAKLAAHRLASLVANARAANARTPFGPGERWLLSLSPHHVGGLAIVVRAMVGGGAVRVGRGPGAVVDDVLADPSITHLSLVATQLRRILDRADVVPRGLRAVLLGGGPAPASWRREAVERGVPLHATYGLTECASQVSTGAAARDDEADDAGAPLDGVDVRISDDGEILVRGPTLFAGYFVGGGALEPASALLDADGFLPTGDLGSLDSRGHVHVHGRRDAMFISGGENLHPEEIENALREIPGVSAACVVAVDDERWQKRPIAFVAGTFDGALDGTAVAAALAARLPTFKWPDRILAMPAEESAKAKPSRAVLVRAVSEAKVLWSRS